MKESRELATERVVIGGCHVKTVVVVDVDGNIEVVEVVGCSRGSWSWTFLGRVWGTIRYDACCLFGSRNERGKRKRVLDGSNGVNERIPVVFERFRLSVCKVPRGSL